MSRAASISSLPEFVSGVSHLQVCSYFGVLKGSWKLFVFFWLTLSIFGIHGSNIIQISDGLPQLRCGFNFCPE